MTMSVTNGSFSVIAGEVVMKDKASPGNVDITCKEVNCHGMCVLICIDCSDTVVTQFESENSNCKNRKRIVQKTPLCK